MLGQQPPGRHTDRAGRWMGVGRSTAADSRAAGAEATGLALRRDDAKLLLVFAGINHDPKALALAVADAAPGIPAIGCSTHGEIGPDGARDGSVVVAALGGDGFSVATAASASVSGRQRAAGAEVARCAAEVDDLGHRTLIMLTDGLARDQETMLRGAYGVVGATVPLFGGAAGDGWQMATTFQLHGREVFTNGVVAACVSSAAPMGIGISHGWQPVGPPMIITRSADGRVYELDNEPALDVYLRHLGAPAEIYHDPAALSRYLLSRPLGLQRRGGVTVRNLSTEVDVDGRSIGGGGDLAQGGLTWAMRGDERSILAAADAACTAALAPLGDRPALGMVTLSCAACRAVLNDDGMVREGARLAARADGTPFAGFYTYGEIARTRGIDGFHNQTMVVLALS